MHTCASFFVMALMVATAAAEDSRSMDPNVVVELQRQAEYSCRAEVETRLAARPKPTPPALARWFSGLTDSSDYCACAARGIATNITPELLKAGAERELTALAKQSGVQCMLPKLKSTFGSACRGMMLEAANLTEPNEAAVALSAEFCACVQRDINLLSSENFEEFTAATARDYAAYKRSPESPIGDGVSLIATMNRCGLDDIKLKLRPR